MSSSPFRYDESQNAYYLGRVRLSSRDAHNILLQGGLAQQMKDYKYSASDIAAAVAAGVPSVAEAYAKKYSKTFEGYKPAKPPADGGSGNGGTGDGGASGGGNGTRPGNGTGTGNNPGNGGGANNNGGSGTQGNANNGGGPAVQTKPGTDGAATGNAPTFGQRAKDYFWNTAASLTAAQLYTKYLAGAGQEVAKQGTKTVLKGAAARTAVAAGGRFAAARAAAGFAGRRLLGFIPYVGPALLVAGLAYEGYQAYKGSGTTPPSTPPAIEAQATPGNAAPVPPPVAVPTPVASAPSGGVNLGEGN